MKFMYNGMVVTLDPHCWVNVLDESGVMHSAQGMLVEPMPSSEGGSSDLASRLMAINEDYIRTLKSLAKDKINE